MKQHSNYELLLKITAICSFAGALTTIFLIFSPLPAAPDFESSNALYDNIMYLSRLWVLFFHPQVNFLASLGIALILFKKYPLQMLMGMLFLFVWAYSEMAQQALLIDAVNQIWRPQLATANDQVTKELYITLIHGANGISDSQYFLVIYGFGIGSLLYGMAFIQETMPAKLLGFALIFIGILSLASFLRLYLGMGVLKAPVQWSYEYIYPYLQPLVRIGMGVWILNKVRYFSASPQKPAD
ncbi:hypothetical protein [Robertkochia aurantiaca]|uniref:hypothetical protein n=1 Tax=Robertkochia aurantiaca TaxID=2873700 RepID=UPI001CCE4C9A|nr:hypothetical protein [Robertkochia sp. 3YJGBD-33]